jgi:hypothetical protein
MSERLKVFFHVGEELGIKTHASKGEGWTDAHGLHVKDKSSGNLLFVRYDDLSNVRMFRLHGLGRVVEVDHRGGRLFIAVTRFMIGQFASINFFRTGKLYAIMSEHLPSKRTSQA